MKGLLSVTDQGLYCAAGDFYIDPWREVERAVITHAHGDHATPGSRSYLAASAGARLFRARVGSDPAVEVLAYGDTLHIKGVRLSFHASGHILGSAQVRLECAGEVWVVSGDYKLEPDSTCAPFEPVRCHVFVTESTFGLPVYRWRPEREVLDAIEGWWRRNQESGRTSVLYAYPLGKAQRVLAGLNQEIGPVFAHGMVEAVNRLYRECGVSLPPARRVDEAARADLLRGLVLAPPLASGTPWIRRFPRLSTGFVSGWMRIRGQRRWRALDRGFVLSDHADWPGLLAAIDATGASRVLTTHGYRGPLAQWLREKGLEAEPVETRFEGERDEAAAEIPE